jgi:predicted nucleotidyltransferase
MGTKDATPTIAGTLFSKAQRALLALFFVRPAQSFYLREVVRKTGIGQGAAQRELARWTQAGLLTRTKRGNQVHYQANPASPVFPELQALAVKSVGVADVLRDALAELAEKITVAFIHGSIARHSETSASDVDLVVVGAVSFGDVVAAIQPAQNTIGREVNPSVYTTREFRNKLRARQHFVTSLMDAPKVFLVGSEREFQRLGT